MAIWTARIALDTLDQIRLETKHSGDLAQAAKGIAETARDNASAANKTAHAAQLSADSVKNIYRAWILTGWTMGNTGDQFDVQLRNYGQTPAQITARHCKTEIIDNERALRNLQLPPQYGDNQVLAPEMIPPQASASLMTSIDIKTNANVLGEWSSVWNGEKITVVYGTIKYLDVLDPTIEHETRFCYWHSYKRNGLRVGGPPEYNMAS